MSATKLPIIIGLLGKVEASYSASVLPSLHTLLRIAGFDAAIDVTGGAEKVTYTPTPGQTGFGSGVFDAYGRGQKFPLTGGYADLKISAEDENAPLFEFILRT